MAGPTPKSEPSPPRITHSAHPNHCTKATHRITSYPQQLSTTGGANLAPPPRPSPAQPKLPIYKPSLPQVQSLPRLQPACLVPRAQQLQHDDKLLHGESQRAQQLPCALNALAALKRRAQPGRALQRQSLEQQHRHNLPLGGLQAGQGQGSRRGVVAASSEQGRTPQAARATTLCLPQPALFCIDETSE